MLRPVRLICRPLRRVSDGVSVARAERIGLRGSCRLVPVFSHPRVDAEHGCSGPQTITRSYNSTPVRAKGKSAPKRSVQIASQRSEAAGDDPFDFNDLEKGLAEAHERLRTTLRQISPAGQVNQESLEAVRVKLKGGETVAVSDLGQVVHKGGRTIAILVGQPEHVKHVTSAILSQLEVNSAPAAQDPQELHVSIPAPTQESRKKAQKQVIEAGERAQHALRNARTAQQKRQRAMEISRRVRGDDLFKAGKEADKVMEKANAEVKKTIEAAKRAMER